MFKAYYCISDGGDGSSSISFFKTLEEAERRAEADLEYGSEGEADEMGFEIEDGILKPVLGWD